MSFKLKGIQVDCTQFFYIKLLLFFNYGIGYSAHYFHSKTLRGIN